jgi:DNA modification methylase
VTAPSSQAPAPGRSPAHKDETVEGVRIIDRFASTGTFLIAAANLGRDALGCDHGPKMSKIALARGVQYAS